MDSRKYLNLSYKVTWRESMDSCKIPQRESKWILALGCEFLTLWKKNACPHLSLDTIHYHQINSSGLEVVESWKEQCFPSPKIVTHVRHFILWSEGIISYYDQPLHFIWLCFFSHFQSAMFYEVSGHICNLENMFLCCG